MTTQNDAVWLDVLAGKAEANDRDTEQAAALRHYFELQAANELVGITNPQGEQHLLSLLRNQGVFDASALQTAQIIVAKIHEQGEAITQLKLQKLLYYVQGWSKALLHKWRFEDPIEAWLYGPVVFAVRQKYADAGRGPINLDTEIFPPADLLIDTVLSIYGKRSAEELVALTHKDTPWQMNYIPMEERVLIPNEDLIGFFCSGEALKTKIHARFFDAYREKKYDIREWTPPREASLEEIAEIEAAMLQ